MSQLPWPDLTSPEKWSVETPNDLTSTLHGPHGTLRMVNLSGSLVEMAEDYAQHSPTHHAVTSRGTYIKRALLASPEWRLANTLDWLTWRRAGSSYRQHTTPKHRQAMEAIQDQPPRLQHTAYAFHELMAWLTHPRAILPSVHLPPVPAGGISVVGNGEDGLIHAHRVDDITGASWTNNAEVVFYHPERGLSYVCVGSMGFFGPTYQGMNEAGITLSIHPHTQTPPNTNAPPYHDILTEVLPNAHSIDEARAILQHSPCPAGATIVMCDGDRAQTHVIEQAPSELGTLRAHHTLDREAHHVLGDTLRKLPLTQAPQPADVVKRRRADALRARMNTTSPNTPAAMLRLLGPARDDPASWFDDASPTIANVSLVIFEPARRRLWVSCGGVPASGGWMVPLTLNGRQGKWDVDAQPMIHAHNWPTHHHAKTYTQLAQVQHAILNHNTRRAHTHMEHALALAPNHPTLQALAGLIAMRDARWQRAEGALRRALEQESTSPEQADQLKLYLSWCLRMKDQPLAAKHLMRDISSGPHIPLTHQQRRRWQRHVTIQDLTHMPLDLIYHTVPAF